MQCEVHSVNNIDDYGLGSATEHSDFTTLVKYPDNSALLFKTDDLVLQIEEDNVICDTDNFDIEIFNITSSFKDPPVSGRYGPLPAGYIADGDKYRVLHPADHYPEQRYYFENEDRDLKFNELDITYVEYFLDVKIDDEIDDKLMCSLNPPETICNVLQGPGFKCPPPGPITQNEATYDFPMNIQDQTGPCED